MHAIVLGSFSFVLIYLFTAVYVCTITIISLLLASTIMTSSCLVVAFGVFPDLSPSAKQQITHIRAPCVSAHTCPLFPVFAVASFFYSVVLSAQARVVTQAAAHVTRRVPIWQCPALLALLLCFQLSPGDHCLCLSVHWLPVTGVPCFFLHLATSLIIG